MYATISYKRQAEKIPDLVQHYATAIKESAPLVRDEKIRPKIIRIFNIWEERGIYDAKLISEFTEIVENVGTVNATENEIVLSSFQPIQLVEGIRTVVALEKSTESLSTDLKNQDFSLTDEEINQLRQTVKERGTSRERMEEFEEAVVALECYLASVQKEIEERTQVVTLLEQAEIFYETQRGEAKLVANAYKNFGNRVKTLKTKLLEKMKTLPEPSPIPSPTLDAPSPENSDEEDLTLPYSGQQGSDSFLDSSAFAEFAKEALHSSGGGSNLDSRISALHKQEESPAKSYQRMSISDVLEFELSDDSPRKDVIADGEAKNVWELAQRSFPARDSMERERNDNPPRSSSESWDTNERRLYGESRDIPTYREAVEIRDKSDSRDQSKPPSRWDIKESRGSRDIEDRKDSHEHSGSSSISRRDLQEHKETRDLWERDSSHREYSSSRERERERRSSRSSRDSRDSHDAGSSEKEYRSSSWDHIGSDKEYSHKSREREYSLSHSTSYDASLSHNSSTSYDSTLQIPKDLKPMSAAELLDTFGKVFNKSLTSGSGVSPTTFEPVPPPSTPSSQAPIPDLSRPPPGLSIPLPPAVSTPNPPTTESPSFPAAPTGVPSPYPSTKPLYPTTYPLPHSNSPKPYCPPLPPPPPPPPPPATTANDSLPFSSYETATTPSWVPPPPPPPPMPGGLMETEISPAEPGYDSGSRLYDPSWSDYDDDDSDDRNWGEPPGKEELEALKCDTPSSPPAFEKGFTGHLAPPPLPPPFCATRSNLRELVSEDSRNNLVNIQPKAEAGDADYRCYNYSSLSEEPKTAPILSIHSLFSSEADQDLRVKKPGLKQGRTESGSDMDISNSESEDNMDISDGSAKEEGNRSGETSVKQSGPGVHKTSNKDTHRHENKGQKVKQGMPDKAKKEAVVTTVNVTSKNRSVENSMQPITAVVTNSESTAAGKEEAGEEDEKVDQKEKPNEEVKEEKSLETIMSINAKEVENILSQMRKASSLNNVSKTNNTDTLTNMNVKVLANAANEDATSSDLPETPNHGNSDNDENASDNSSRPVNRNGDESSNGPLNDSADDVCEKDIESEKQHSDLSQNLEQIPSVIAGIRASVDRELNSHNTVTEGNMIDVIDVMKNLDREFNQIRPRGNRGGGPIFTSRGGRGGMSPYGAGGRGERFTSPHSPRGWYGGPMFNSPRSRGRGMRGDFNRGSSPFSPTNRGGFRGSDSRGRNWYSPQSWF
ncbi:hypothetical protein SK128_017806 [Halocaridina rubra]|uniref:CID domain-containing protein n=1 Tax=Halocaridina rubra TaxID=373956 RepID=A0AAN9A873_HALRR